MEKLKRARDVTLRIALGGAWLFAVGSVVTLGLIAWLMWPGTDSVSHIMGADSPEGHTVAFPGFRYVGVPGLVLILGELALIGTALLLSVMPWQRPRRIGHMALVAWAAWWMAGGVYAWSWQQGFWWTALLPLLGLLLGCTIVRAVRGWRSRPRGSQPVSSEADALPAAVQAG